MSSSTGSSNLTIASGNTATLSAPLTSGTAIEFLNDSGVSGSLILQDSALFNAFTIATTTVGSTVSISSATIGGTVQNFLPGNFGILGDTVTIQAFESLFAALDVSPTASSDNTAFDGHLTFAAQGGISFTVSPSGTVTVGESAPFTLDPNMQLVVEEAVQAVFGTALAADHATLDISFAERTNPNSNNPFVDALITTNMPVNPCFVAGTRILTAYGEQPVEALTPGMRVITQSGEEREVMWVGHRRIELARYIRPETVRPILIEPGALGAGVPARRLALSPDHALLLDGVLVPAKELVNWTSIHPDYEAADFIYYHIELARHDVIFAEGAPAETYLDTGQRGVFDNAASVIRMHPEVMQRRREAYSCAPLCLEGPMLAAIRHRLAVRRAAGC